MKKSTLTKHEFGLIMGWSPRAVSERLNKSEFNDIAPLGYKKNSKTLSCRVIQYFEPDWNYESSEKFLNEIKVKVKNKFM